MGFVIVWQHRIVKMVDQVDNPKSACVVDLYPVINLDKYG